MQRAVSICSDGRLEKIKVIHGVKIFLLPAMKSLILLRLSLSEHMKIQILISISLLAEQNESNHIAKQITAATVGKGENEQQWMNSIRRRDKVNDDFVELVRREGGAGMCAGEGLKVTRKKKMWKFQPRKLVQCGPWKKIPKKREKEKRKRKRLSWIIFFYLHDLFSSLIRPPLDSGSSGTEKARWKEGE